MNKWNFYTSKEIKPQGWPKFALSAFMHNGNTIINSVMLPSVLNDDGIEIKLETNYPFENKMHYYIDAEKTLTLQYVFRLLQKILK